MPGAELRELQARVMLSRLFAALLLVASLTNCGNTGTGSSTNPNNAPAAAPAAQPAVQPTPTIY